MTGQYDPTQRRSTEPARSVTVVTRPSALGSVQNFGVGRPHLPVIRMSWPPTWTVVVLSVGAMRMAEEGPRSRFATPCSHLDSLVLHLVSVMKIISMEWIVISAIVSRSLSSFRLLAFIVQQRRWP